MTYFDKFCKILGVSGVGANYLDNFLAELYGNSDLDRTYERGNILHLSGEQGIGKSSLLKVLAGEDGYEIYEGILKKTFRNCMILESSVCNEKLLKDNKKKGVFTFAVTSNGRDLPEEYYNTVKLTKKIDLEAVKAIRDELLSETEYWVTEAQREYIEGDGGDFVPGGNWDYPGSPYLPEEYDIY